MNSLKSFRSYLLAGLASLSLVALFFLGTARSVQSQGPPQGTNVKVINTPLPVTGNVTAAVSGPISAQQSGTWNVGINGTPSVNIANTPDHALPTRDVDAAARHAFQKQVTVGMDATDVGGKTFFTVPAGKRLVIEYVSAGSSSVAADLYATSISILTTVNGNDAFYALPMTPDSGSHHGSLGSQVVRIYADPGAVQVSAFREGTGGLLDVTITVSGYLVDMP